MKLFIIGASGRTGQHLMAQALTKGHAVTAFGRAPPTTGAAGATFISGDPRQMEALAATLPGHDAVISCLGQRTAHDAGLLTAAAQAALTAMSATGVRRYIVVSQGLLFQTANPIVLVLRKVLARHVADSHAMEAATRNSSIDWTIVRPPRLSTVRVVRGFRIAVNAPLPGNWSMSYVDLAGCLLYLVETGYHSRNVVSVGSA